MDEQKRVNKFEGIGIVIGIGVGPKDTRAMGNNWAKYGIILPNQHNVL